MSERRNPESQGRRAWADWQKGQDAMMRYRVERLTILGWQEVCCADEYRVASDLTAEFIEGGERGVRIIDTKQRTEIEDDVVVCFLSFNPSRPLP